MIRMTKRKKNYKILLQVQPIIFLLIFIVDEIFDLIIKDGIINIDVTHLNGNFEDNNFE